MSDRPKPQSAETTLDVAIDMLRERGFSATAKEAAAELAELRAEIAEAKAENEQLKDLDDDDKTAMWKEEYEAAWRVVESISKRVRERDAEIARLREKTPA